ncbi:MAG: bacteriophage N4 adsorption protein B [Candidatus Omnitrophica bacterium ADurb.Bin277]|nr:MAG: bacteriophage N4 adsorption protein B [Candidatus Omnitrophica bacterium ADurb.Bin277]
MKEKTRKKLGEILIEDGLIKPAQLSEALEHQSRQGGLIGQILIDKGFIDEDDLGSALGKQFRIPYIPLSRYSLNPETAELLEADFCNQNLAVAFDVDAKRVFLAMSNPLDQEVIQEVKKKTRRDPQIFISRISEILNAIFYLYHEKK